MIVKATALAAALEQHTTLPVCVIEGEEDQLRERALAILARWVLGDEPDALFNRDVFYADEADVSTIVTCAQEISVFAPRRLVVVKRAEKLSAKDNEAWLGYLADPNPSTTLLIVAAKLDKRLKLTQALMKQPLVVDCSPLVAASLPAWIRTEAKELGVVLSDEGLQALKESSGHGLAMVRRELEKLAVMLPAGRVAGVVEVETARGVEPGASVFDLTTAIGTRDRRKALTILARNLESGEAPLRILGALLWQYRRLWKMKELLGQGGKEGEVARTLRMEPFKVRAFLGRFSEPHLRQAFDLFLESDSKLKGAGAGSGRRVLETVLLSLCES